MKKTNQWLFAGSLLIFLILFAIMLINLQLIQPLDDAIRVVVNSHRTPVWNTFFINFTQLFNPNETIIWVIITIILSWIMANRHFTLQVALTIATGVLLNRGIKLLIKRPRPSTNILMHYSSYSFPSGHSSAAVLVLGSLILLTWRVAKHQWTKWLVTIFMVVLALAIGFSRVYVGAHYPSDVLAGWCLGTMVVSGYQLLFSKFK
ncbi:phosphatase PAP2 family protein [Limosilactobacillus caecicola]|uniref:phosphatase PAP2 family protein n=1 Tax=Limosilactobacillus caecicola TaxID=2941332 RepID=UPI00203DC801|nr:phosphatase PAP2 family protein [Limosilactobacillus caecicola]